MTELEQRIANARHDYAVYVDWEYRRRVEEFNLLIEAVKAEAWDEGYWTAINDIEDGVGDSPTRNPYREEITND